MSHDDQIRRLRKWYRRLLRLYPSAYRARFAESMEQTFTDRLHDRAREGRSVLGCGLWMLGETLVALLREREHVVTPFVLLRVALGTSLILLVPWVAMRFSNEVNWDRLDFVVAGGLLFGAGLAFEVLARRGGTIAYRFAMGVAIFTALLLTWMNLAVGIIGSENHPANQMYAGVLLIGILGAVVARLEPSGMSRALFATAVAQMLVALIAWAAGFGFSIVLNGAFAVLWISAALLFRRAEVSTRA